MRFGAETNGKGTRFTLWAPKCETVKLRVQGEPRPATMTPDEAGFHHLELAEAGAGTRYKFVLPGGMEIPDPASRYQPDDVHGWSEVVDPNNYKWSDGGWVGRPWEETIIYELHVGTFTKEGTYAAASRRLDYLVSLGVTAIQLMPLADFFGRFNWGYDGSMWFAPESSYGTPDELKALIDCAHMRGLMVFLDVVYNHFGPHGNYLPVIAPIFSDEHKSPWGDGINVDGEGSPIVRSLIIDSALYWVNEFNFDGLRLDAVHAIADYSTTHILEVLAARLRASRPLRHTHLMVENDRNQAGWLTRQSDGFPDHFTAQWNDDLHHLLHSAATGEHTGYYADFDSRNDGGKMLGRALAEGFAYQGQKRPNKGVRRGEPSAGLPPTAFVSYIQNHDQVGNRVYGDRLTALADPDAIRAIASIYLLAPQIPMLFMGQEWSASTPFPFFADTPPDLHKQMLQGRKEELKATPEHAAANKPDVEETIDPTLVSTFESARLDWGEHKAGDHARMLEFHRRLIDLRQSEIVPRLKDIDGFSGLFRIIGDQAVFVQWKLGDGTQLRLYANLSSTEESGITPVIGRRIWTEGVVEEGRLGPWAVVFTVSNRT